MPELLDQINGNPEAQPEQPASTSPTPTETAPQRPPFLQRREGRILVLSLLCFFAAAVVITSIFYLKFAKLIDARLSAGPFSDTINVYSAPRTVAVGDPLTLEEVLQRLRRAGYSTARGNSVGWYNLRPHAIEIFPGRSADSGGEPGVIEFANGKISRIVALGDNTERREFELEPQLLMNLSEKREKRHLVRYNEIPPSLVKAVTSAEDKHFFRHTGFDLLRIMKAAYVDLKDGKKEQGASTLSMQLARGLWLEPDKRWKRKIEELLITMHLEHKLTKQQIFEDYANQVYLGRRGPFSINGFGEGARDYFNKDLSQLTVPEAATLAGMVQRPSYFNPYRNPDRVRDRRDVVLGLMHQNGYLDAEEYQAALQTPLKVEPAQSENMASQYFIDLMSDELQNKMEERTGQPRYVYTTLDSDLQQAAEEAVQTGMAKVDRLLHSGRKKAKESIPPGQPQVALIALDPHTGEIKALVGGRNYGASQLNHVLAMRQPGSSFKPFVYAAALETAVTGGNEIFTPATVVDDNPTDFSFNGRIYSPSNFHHDFMGRVTLRTALAHSLNVGTVSLAERVGYQKVVAMAYRAGLNGGIKPTPAVALGSYETTPLEIAGAYTLFANSGLHVTPTTVSLVRGADGTVLYKHSGDARPALDPRVAYLMTNMMQEVLRSGTGAGVHSFGIKVPMAGKTGTSHDGWFAGYTSDLLCVVWVGFDDNRELGLEGAHSALPIWAEFMKRAMEMRPYRDAKAFKAPAGIDSVEICADSGQLAGDNCPRVRSEVFIDGTEPVVKCQLHSEPQMNFADRVMELPPGSVAPADSAANPSQQPAMQPKSAQPVVKKDQDN